MADFIFTFSNPTSKSKFHEWDVDIVSWFLRNGQEIEGKINSGEHSFLLCNYATLIPLVN